MAYNQRFKWMIKDFKYIKNVLDIKYCNQLTEYLLCQNFTEKDWQCPNSYKFANLKPLIRILNKTKPLIEKETGLELYPTYVYGRIYQTGEILHEHTDRESCEISMTVTLGYDSHYNWPIKMFDNPIAIEVGDGVIYKGREVRHSREEFSGNWHCQIFLHYVDKNGQYRDWKYDKRERL
jgi:adenosyl cobinamide kinase/adenosyl cobinamide phosphate guanylyltransferase